MNINLEKTIQDFLLKTSEKLVKEAIQNDRAWTHEIKIGLTKIAYEHNYRVYTHRNDFDDTVNEWLYDMTWYEAYDEKGYDIKSIPLILESEWKRSFEEIKYDFYKLIQGRADLRVFIFQAANVDGTMNQLVEIIDKSSISQAKDKYLLAGWHDYDGFTFRVHTKPHQIPV